MKWRLDTGNIIMLLGVIVFLLGGLVAYQYAALSEARRDNAEKEKQIQDIKKQVQDQETILDKIDASVDRVIRYQRCVSALRFNNGDQPVKPKEVDACDTGTIKVNRVPVTPQSNDTVNPEPRVVPTKPKSAGATPATKPAAPQETARDDEPEPTEPVLTPTQPQPQPGIVRRLLNGLGIGGRE